MTDLKKIRLKANIAKCAAAIEIDYGVQAIQLKRIDAKLNRQEFKVSKEDKDRAIRGHKLSVAITDISMLIDYMERENELLKEHANYLARVLEKNKILF